MTTSQLARTLGVSPATVRLWCSKFETAIPVWKDANGRWLYTPLVIERLSQAQTALRGGNTFEQVVRMIESGTIHEMGQNEGTDTLLPAPLMGAIEDLRAEVRQLHAFIASLVEAGNITAHNRALIAANENGEEGANETLTELAVLREENEALRVSLEEKKAHSKWSWRRRTVKAAGGRVAEKPPKGKA